MQLLFFYELHPDRPRPKIICSGKSACHLCNLFQLHGGFQVPRAHGRLCEKWTIPDWLDIPVQCHESLSFISTRLKTILKGGIQRQSEGKKEKKHTNIRTSERECLTTSRSLDIIISSTQECDDYIFGFNVYNSATSIYPGEQRSN
jgi:hypothetical protein